eukprot:scaffold660_cov365-Pavlova_lutheri.AAC.11
MCVLHTSGWIPKPNRQAGRSCTNSIKKYFESIPQALEVSYKSLTTVVPRIIPDGRGLKLKLESNQRGNTFICTFVKWPSHCSIEGCETECHDRVPPRPRFLDGLFVAGAFLQHNFRIPRVRTVRLIGTDGFLLSRGLVAAGSRLRPGFRTPPVLPTRPPRTHGGRLPRCLTHGGSVTRLSRGVLVLEWKPYKKSTSDPFHPKNGLRWGIPRLESQSTWARNQSLGEEKKVYYLQPSAIENRLSTDLWYCGSISC